MSEFSFSNQAGIPSGPVALVLVRLASFLLTDISDTWYDRIFSIGISSPVSGSRASKSFVGSKNVLLIIMARSFNSVGLFSNPQSKFRKREIGSTRTCDEIPLSFLTSFHHSTREQVFKYSTFDELKFSSARLAFSIDLVS